MEQELEITRLTPGPTIYPIRAHDPRISSYRLAHWHFHFVWDTSHKSTSHISARALQSMTATTFYLQHVFIFFSILGTGVIFYVSVYTGSSTPLNDHKKSKFHSNEIKINQFRGMLAIIQFRNLCLPTCYLKPKWQNKQDSNIVWWKKWVRNLVFHTEEIKETEDVREQDARENIQMDGGGSNRKSGETCMMKSFKKFYASPHTTMMPQ